MSLSLVACFSLRGCVSAYAQQTDSGGNGFARGKTFTEARPGPDKAHIQLKNALNLTPLQRTTAASHSHITNWVILYLATGTVSGRTRSLPKAFDGFIAGESQADAVASESRPAARTCARDHPAASAAATVGDDRYNANRCLPRWVM
jgi:hypothetical protein